VDEEVGPDFLRPRGGASCPATGPDVRTRLRAQVEPRHGRRPPGPSPGGTPEERRRRTAADEEGFTGTDECSLLERAGVPVTVVPGAESNLKVTRPEDMMIAEAMLGRAEPPRIGHGYDAHRFAAGRELVLGGVRIDWDLGLDGHSDADVLCHAVCDAILGALAAGDIGSHFPDSDPAYRGISSLKLLEEVAAMAGKRGCVVASLDATVIAQAPKLAPHISAMRENLARSAGISPDRVSVKATTTEKMGFCGRGEGIAAHAVALLVAADSGIFK